MIPIAKKLESAIFHFLQNTCPVSCETKYGSKMCKTLKQANDFFKNPPKKKRNKVRPIK